MNANETTWPMRVCAAAAAAAQTVGTGGFARADLCAHFFSAPPRDEIFLGGRKQQARACEARVEFEPSNPAPRN